MTAEDPQPVSRMAKALGLLVAIRAVWRAAGSGKPAPPPSLESAPDPAERTVPESRRAETVVAILLFGAALCGFAFTAIYVVLSGNTQMLGLSMGLALGLVAAGAIVAGKFVVPLDTTVTAQTAASVSDLYDHIRNDGEPFVADRSVARLPGNLPRVLPLYAQRR